jgi:hypothetical protein
VSVAVAVTPHLLDLEFDFIDFLITALTTTHHRSLITSLIGTLSDAALAGGNRHDTY